MKKQLSQNHLFLQKADGSYKDVEYRATTKFSDITLEPGTEAIANKLLIKYTKEINKSKVLMDVGERPKIIKSKSARDVEIKGQSKDDFGISSNYLTDEELMTESYGGMFDPNNIQGILLNASPSSFPINKDKVIIICDDVLHSGKTLIHASKAFLNTSIKKMSVLVLIDRNHNSYPMKADYVGLSLSTTLKEYIEVVLSGDNQGVYLS